MPSGVASAVDGVPGGRTGGAGVPVAGTAASPADNVGGAAAGLRTLGARVLFVGDAAPTPSSTTATLFSTDRPE